MACLQQLGLPLSETLLLSVQPKVDGTLLSQLVGPTAAAAARTKVAAVVPEGDCCVCAGMCASDVLHCLG